jgi:cell division protein FtsL
MMMNYAILFLLVIIISLVIIGLAMAYYHRQRILQEKKIRYLNVKKENSAHWRRYESYQADIDRLRSNYNTRLREMALFKIDIDAKKKEIKEILEILKEETKHVDSVMDRDLVRIIDRRKDILKKLWTEQDGKKAAYLEKLQLARQNQVSVDIIGAKREQEYKLWDETKFLLERLKKEYDLISKRSFFPFGMKP